MHIYISTYHIVLHHICFFFFQLTMLVFINIMIKESDNLHPN